jgi:SOS-response transcriptional repressor LexA
METNINQRVIRVIETLIYLGIINNRKELSEKLGYTESSLSQILNEKVPMSKKFINRLLNFYDRISESWLLYGEGEMLKSNSSIGTAINNGTNNGNIIGYNNGNVNSNSNDVEEVDAEVIPYVDTALARKRNFNIAKAINNDSELLKQRTLDELFAPISFIIKMHDNSMSDEIRQGDLLFVKFIPKDANIISGKIYLIDTNSYGTLVRQVYVNEDSFTLHAFNPSYEDIIITRDDIFNFCIVEHSLRSSFLIPDNTISTIAAESAKQVSMLIAEAKEQSKRLDQERARQDKLLEKQSELIDILLKNK